MQRAFAAAVACVTLTATSARGQTLKGSPASVDRQHAVAVGNDFTFLSSPGDVRRFVGLGLLVPIRGGPHYELGSVSYPYARPAVGVFVERLAAQYQAACGEKLVVTSLTRPTDRQPRNASDLSVHPAGMAVDLRVSNRASCRRWLEGTLLALEKSGVLEATRERHPSHYHVAVFPQQYLGYVERITSHTVVAAAAAAEAPASTTSAADAAAVVADASSSSDAPAAAGPAAEPDPPTTADYRVNRGDTLWSIARRTGSSVRELKSLNGLRSSRIAAGQVLVVPTGNQQ